MHRNRCGFALISVVVISAVMLTTVVLISVAAQSARKIQTEQVLSQETLYRAEQALQDTVRKLRTDTAAADTLINSGKYDVAPVADAGSVGLHNYHWVKVRRNTVSGLYEFMSASIQTRVAVSSLANLSSVPESVVLSRRIVKAVLAGEGHSKPLAFNYSVYSGGTFSVTGGGVMINPGTAGGDVYAGVSVDLNGKPTLKGVEFYSHGTVGLGNPTLDPSTYPSGTTAADITHERVTAVPFPDVSQLDAQYQALFQQFINGSAPFDGSKTADGYPNINSPSAGVGFLSVKDSVASVLKPTSFTSGSSTTWYATLDDANAFYQAVETGTLPGLTTAQKADLKAGVNKMVFYVRDSATDPNAVLGQGVSKNAAKTKEFNMAGTVFCPGAVTINGTTKVLGTEAFALYSIGSITINGEGSAEGAFVTGGELTKNGAWTFTGSIAAAGNVTVHGGGGVTLTFKDYNSAVDQSLPGFSSLVAAPSGWSEIDWNAFQNVS